MNGTANLKTASERLKEAQQLLLLAIEKGTVSSLDRDLILEKLRKAYDYILFENEIENPVAIPQPIKVKVDKTPEIPTRLNVPEVRPQVNQVLDSELAQIKPKDEVIESTKKAERISIFDPSIKGLSEIKDVKEKVEAKGIEEQKEEKPKQQAILKTEQPESLAEKFQGNRQSMTDSLSNQFKDKPVASQLQNKPISDLTKEIGVHDKFLFIKELFNGDSTLYEDTLNKVNQFGDISEALIYIQENFSWSDNSKAAGKFIELIRRKLLNN